LVDRTKRHDRSKPSRYGQQNAGVVNPRARQRAFCVAVLPPGGPDSDGRDELAELKELMRTAGVAVAGELTQRRPHADANNYLGKGKLAELKEAIERSGANLVACDDELAPRQERNLEQATGLPVIDRTAIILDIFADHAASAEGKLQVELAQLQYNLARMRGLWTHLERLGGGIGTRGPGESQIETDRRLARDRIAQLKRRLERSERARVLGRSRRERSELPTIALAGYTNAGKSTLHNALTDAGVSVGERLFHTLDPTTRSFRHEGRDYLVTDTVGFIRKLPHQLVDAFKATLEETTNADLILHVVDASAPEEELEAMLRAVDEVLDEIGAGSSPRLLVLNKVDLLDDDERRMEELRHPGAALVSAVTGEGVEDLMNRIEAAFRDRLQTIELLVPFDSGRVLSELHDVAGDLEREDTPEGVRVRARVPAGVAARLRPYELNGRPPA
jgi:GTPase